jgi:5'-nucleotidase
MVDSTSRRLRRSVLPFLVLVVFVGLFAACDEDTKPTTPDAGGPRLVIFHTNDEHSHMAGFGPEIDDFPVAEKAGTGAIVGSIARRKKKLEEERAAAKANSFDTLTVSAGDQTQGALPQVAFQTTAPDFVALKQLGYDVMCPGNHEFDLGPAALASSITAARAGGGVPQFVSSNIHFDADKPEDDTLAALHGDGKSDKPIKTYHVIVTPSGFKVGFLGIMGAEASFYAPLKTPVKFSGDLQYDGDRAKILPELYKDIQPVIDTLRNDEKVDLVVALSHGGVNKEHPEIGDDQSIAANVKGLDVIISGHSHTALDVPIVVKDPDGHDVPIVQAGYYGQYLGRIEFTFPKGGRPKFVPANTKLIKIDDTIVPDPATADDPLQKVISDLETLDFGAEKRSFLEIALSRIMGNEVIDGDALGDLYYKELGKTDFNVVGLRSFTETNLLNLSGDAMLATAEEVLAEPTYIAVQGAGSVRADLLKGKTGVLSFADLFRAFPLGMNPVDGSMGYPLTAFYVYTVEVKGALEVAANQGLLSDSFFLSGTGVRVEFDTSRPAQDISDLGKAFDADNGRVTKILVDVDHTDGYDNPTEALFDLSRGVDSAWDNDKMGWSNLSLHRVVTSLYVASFAKTAGVTLKDKSGNAVDSLTDTILRRKDGSDIKDWEAFLTYVHNECKKNGGKLPARYDETSTAGKVPRHMICKGPLCPK